MTVNSLNKYLLVPFAFLLLISGCTIPGPNVISKKEIEKSPIGAKSASAPLTYRDESYYSAPEFFKETPQSRAVNAGSRYFANANYCEFIRTYRLKTNVDFNSAINLFKYRAYFMGARRVVIMDSSTNIYRDQEDAELILHPGYSSTSTLSYIVGDLYECPASKEALY